MNLGTAKVRWAGVLLFMGTIVPVLLATLCLGSMPGRALSQSVPAGFSIENAFPTASFYLPSLLVFMPDGRKLVVEKEGRIWVVTAGGFKNPTPFVDLSAKVLSNEDRGLHGVALDPDFATNRWVYLLYTVDPDSDSVDDEVGAFARVERYRTQAVDPDRLDLDTRQLLIGSSWALGIPEPCTNRHHMVGTLRFASDKTLLVGSGDAANAGAEADAGGADPLDSYGPGKTDPAEDIGAFRARTLNSLDGKILRVEKETGRGLPSNPYWDGNAISDRSRVWVYGLRNPFRFSIRPGTGASDPASGQPGVLYVGDVGWNTTEELSIVRQGGLNLGWPCVEGAYPQSTYQAVTATYYPDPNVICSAGTSGENPRPGTSPALWWDHSNGAHSNPAGWVGNCSIGGVFYAGASYPEGYSGAYFIADYGAGWIRRVQVDANDNVVATYPFIEGAGGVVDVEADPQSGDLYYVDINTSTIYRVRYSPDNLPPVVDATMTPTSGYVPLTVVATASASTDPDGDPLTYSWDFGDGGTSASPDTAYTYLHVGTYQATVTVRDARGGTSLLAFIVVAGQVPPPGNILWPTPDAFFHQNQQVQLEATEVDTTQGPASYRWDIDLHHNNHVHWGVETHFGRWSSFVPTTPNDGNAYHLGIRLAVTQGALVSRDSLNIWPRLNVTPIAASFSPAEPPRNQPFQATMRVRSTGEVGSSPSTYEVREDTVILAGGALPPILNGDSLDVVTTIGPLSPGVHTIRFVVDPANDLFETDESDNEITGSVSVGGLVAAYGFDEGLGVTAGDASGHGNTGAIQGAAWTSAGKYGGALSFDGLDDYVDLGNPALLQMTGSMTLSAWVRANADPPNDGQIIAKSDSDSGWELKTTPDTGTETFGVAVSGAVDSRTQRYSAGARTLGTWYHVAGVYNAATRRLDIYVNGVLNNGQISGAIPGSQVDSNQHVTIGKRFGGYCFNGVIDEVRIFNRVLSQTEIQADMNTPIADMTTTAVQEIDAGSPPPARDLVVHIQPSPFRRMTSIRYAIPEDGHVRLQVFRVTGQLVTTILDQVQAAGPHEFQFEPKQLSSGLYICRLQAAGSEATAKLFYIR